MQRCGLQTHTKPAVKAHWGTEGRPTRLRAVAGKVSQPGGGAAPESAAACWTRRKVQTAKAHSRDENTT